MSVADCKQPSHLKMKKIKKVPPEGGWGYLIGIGMATCFVSDF
jgi:hypothetical protein